MTPFEKFEIIKECFEVPIEMSEFKTYDSKINYYKKLAQYDDFETSMDIQMYWLERLGYKPEKIQVPKNVEMVATELSNHKKKFYDSYLKNRIVEKKEMENHKHQKKDGGFSEKYYDINYLKEHGIDKKGDKAKFFEEIYNVKLSKGQKVNVNEVLYEIQSYTEGTETHNTYYVLHPIESINN